MPDVQSLFPKRRDVTPDAGEVLAAFFRPEAPGHLPLHAPRPDVPLGLVVVKRDTFVVQEAQHRLAVLRAPQGQVPSWCLFRPASSPGDPGRRGVGVQACLQPGIKAFLEDPRDLRSQPPLLSLVVHPSQRVKEVSRPHLSVMLGQTAQFAQQMIRIPANPLYFLNHTKNLISIPIKS